MSTAAARPAYRCPECRTTSEHPQDAQEDYCAAPSCRRFNGGPDGWLWVALHRRLREAGPYLRFTPENCPDCDSILVMGEFVDDEEAPHEGVEFWWCATWSCRRSGLSYGRPKPIIREVGGFYGDVG
ncbi:hypothetical protein AB0A05_27155 [Streptomyces sp. NPDC046374]|uniref:hypothetical protein n=1 Tax=Streptomyces sp. NPDC046374 TaxID=3154917 RepID=UPI00340D1140